MEHMCTACGCSCLYDKSNAAKDAADHQYLRKSVSLSDTLATSTQRTNAANGRTTGLHEACPRCVAADAIEGCTLDVVYKKINLETLPDGFVCSRISDKILLYKLDISRGIIAIECGIIVTDDYQIICSSYSEVLPANVYEDLLSQEKYITSISHLLILMNRLSKCGQEGADTRLEIYGRALSVESGNDEIESTGETSPVASPFAVCSDNLLVGHQSGEKQTVIQPNVETESLSTLNVSNITTDTNKATVCESLQEVESACASIQQVKTDRDTDHGRLKHKLNPENLARNIKENKTQHVGIRRSVQGNNVDARMLISSVCSSEAAAADTLLEIQGGVLNTSSVNDEMQSLGEILPVTIPFSVCLDRLPVGYQHVSSKQPTKRLPDDKAENLSMLKTSRKTTKTKKSPVCESLLEVERACASIQQVEERNTSPGRKKRKQNLQNLTKNIKKIKVQRSETRKIVQGCNVDSGKPKSRIIINSLEDLVDRGCKAEKSDKSAEDGQGSKCPLCARILSSPRILKQHVERVHMNERQHHCTQCPISFNIESHLAMHMKQVHGDKKYNCNMCEYSSNINHNLQLHIASVHYHQKPNKCVLCDSRFSQKAHLTQHIKSVHIREKSHACNQCEYNCSQKSTLTRHKQTVHGPKNTNQAQNASTEAQQSVASS